MDTLKIKDKTVNRKIASFICEFIISDIDE